MPNFDFPNPDGPFPEKFPFPVRPLPFEWDRPVWTNVKWPVAQVRILVVSDGSYYDMEPDTFSLGYALADMSDMAHPDFPSYARFLFTKAHRSTDSSVTPGFENFTFTPGSLDKFDEVWLIGVETGAPYLSAQEVATIEAFMDSGGGVLAMGDHEDLGLGLCGGIKRVRSMRKWWFENPAPPPGMLIAPDDTNLDRNDTQQPPLPGSQEDTIPQPIFPRYKYAWPFFKPILMHQRYPHPILCGPRGAIKVFPDHLHEGDCIMPDPAFAGEFPGGVPVEIVADGKNVIAEKAGYVISVDRPFGLLGAWDGHEPAADMGRVVVDSTWHHWFNLNLVRLRAAGGRNYDDILAAFRNIAIWLAPKARQAEMRRAGLSIVLGTASIVEEVLTMHEMRPAHWYNLGTARDALGRIAPQCQAAAWHDWVVSPALSARLNRYALNDNRADPAALVEQAVLEVSTSTAFGAAINALAVAVNKRGFTHIAELGEELDKLVLDGAERGFAHAAKQLGKSVDIFSALTGERVARAD